MNQGPTEKYLFQESLSQIIDDASHPLHKTYVEALTTIRRPCSHEAVNLERNPEDVFDDGVMEYLITNYQTHLLPIQEAMCDDFTREYQLYAYLGSGCEFFNHFLSPVDHRLSLRSRLQRLILATF
jgi:hypothetical protein